MSRTEKAAKQYWGDTARGYEARRVKQVKWQREQEVLEPIIAALSQDAPVLDCPCGTGRLFPFFAAANVEVDAVDISDDMLAEARKVLDGLRWHRVTLKRGSIFDLPFGDKRFDAAFAIRIMNRIGAADVPLALKELQRVTRKAVIFNLRLPGNPKHRHPVEMAVVEGALEPGWRIAADVEIHEPTFRMITLERECGDAVD